MCVRVCVLGISITQSEIRKLRILKRHIGRLKKTKLDMPSAQVADTGRAVASGIATHGWTTKAVPALVLVFLFRFI